MSEEEIKAFTAEKLIFYRREAGFTQSELAEKINYSDKSVSKWERGEGMPDICVLGRIGEVCGFSLEEFFSTADVAEKRKAAKKKKVIVPLLSVGILWLASVIACFVLQMVKLPQICHIVLLSAIPAMFVIFIVFAAVWWTLPVCAGMVSGLIWSAVLCLYLLLPQINVMFLIIVAVVLQIMTVLWVLLRIHRKK